MLYLELFAVFGEGLPCIMMGMPSSKYYCYLELLSCEKPANGFLDIEKLLIKGLSLFFILNEVPVRNDRLSSKKYGSLAPNCFILTDLH